MAKGDDIESRLVSFAVGVMKLCDKLPKNAAGNHISNQLLRSGTAAAPNYAEARGAESPFDFIHKLGVVLKELNESKVWLEMISQRELSEKRAIAAVLDECVALCKIITASRRTAAQNAGKMKKA
jgi:four helix bundle protein